MPDPIIFDPSAELLTLFLVVSLCLFIYTFAAFGLAYAIGRSDLTEGMRAAWSAWANRKREMNDRHDPFLLRLIECPACLGGWIGLGVGAFAAPSIPLVPNYIIVVVLCFYTIGMNFTLGKLTHLID